MTKDNHLRNRQWRNHNKFATRHMNKVLYGTEKYGYRTDPKTGDRLGYGSYSRIRVKRGLFGKKVVKQGHYHVYAYKRSKD